MTFLIGPTCSVPGCMCPPWKDRLCSGHWRLARVFTGWVNDLSEDVLSGDLILDSRSVEFDRELAAWRNAA